MEPNYRNPALTNAMRETIEQEVIDRHIILGGAFKEEIDRLSALRTEIDEKMGVVKALDEAAAVKLDAQKRAAVADEAAAQIIAEAEVVLVNATKEAAARLSAIQERETALAAQSAAAHKLLAEADNERSTVKAAVSKVQSDTAAKLQQLDDATQELARREQELLAQTEALAKREQALKAKLAALSSLTV